MEQRIKDKIRIVKDYPKKGIVFQDITTLLKDPVGLKLMADAFAARYKSMRIDAVAGIESRGFIPAVLIADRLGVGFIPIRKKGKLPCKKVSVKYELEYGSAEMEIHRDALRKGERVLIADDLLATGGTALAACSLVRKLGGEVVECCFIISRPDLSGKKKLEKAGYNVFSLVEF